MIKDFYNIYECNTYLVFILRKKMKISLITMQKF